MKRLIKKKLFFTLIEVLISMGLMAILSSTLFFWVRFALINHKGYQNTKWVALEEYYCSERLEKFFTSSTLNNHDKTAQPLLTFYSRNNSIIFTCDVGSYPDPKLSKVVLAELFLTSNDILTIALWPLPYKDQRIDQTPSLVLPLLDHVKKIDLSFYHPDDPFKLPVNPEEVGKRKAHAGWNVEWPKEAALLPTFIKIVIDRQFEDLSQSHLEWLFETDSTKAITIAGSEGKSSS